VNFAVLKYHAGIISSSMIFLDTGKMPELLHFYFILWNYEINN